MLKEPESLASATDALAQCFLSCAYLIALL